MRKSICSFANVKNMCVQLSLPEERIRIIFIDKSLYRLYLDCNALPFEFIDRGESYRKYIFYER